MYYTNETKANIEKVLNKVEVSFDEIRYHQNGKVSIRVVVTDTRIIQDANYGIFSGIKIDAIKIWDMLGSVNNDEQTEDIDYFVIFCEGRAIAVFNIFPDVERIAYNAQERVKDGWTEEREEVLLNAAIEVELTGSLDEVVNEIIRTKFNSKCQARVKHAAIRFKKDILELLPDYSNLVLDKKNKICYT